MTQHRLHINRHCTPIKAPCKQSHEVAYMENIHRGVNDHRVPQAGCVFCPFLLAHPSIPDARHGFLQQMVLLVPMCGNDVPPTGGPDSNQSTSPHLPQNKFKIMPRATKIKADKDVMRKWSGLSSHVFCAGLRSQLEHNVLLGMLSSKTI